MKLYFTDQRQQFKKHLEALKSAIVIPYRTEQLKHKMNSIQLDCSFSDFNPNRLFDYHIFPANILSALPQWVQEGRAIQAGDTIAQQINIPPFKSIAQRMIVGVRVREVFNNGSIKGFSYETLEGHVEKGISHFRVENHNNKVIFKIETYSAPAMLLTKILTPISSWYQDYCTKKALENLDS